MTGKRWPMAQWSSIDWNTEKSHRYWSTSISGRLASSAGSVRQSIVDVLRSIRSQIMKYSESARAFCSSDR